MPTPYEVQQATPDMLSRKTAGGVLGLHIVEATSKRRKSRSWVPVVLYAAACAAIIVWWA